MANVAPNVSKAVTVGVSYDGIDSALNMNSRRIPNVAGRIGIAPVRDTAAAPTLTGAIADLVSEPLSVYTGKRFLSRAPAIRRCRRRATRTPPGPTSRVAR